MDITNATKIQDNRITPERKCVLVRMTMDQYEELSEDSDTTGESVPELLRRAYFGKAKVTVLMNREDAKSVMGHLGRIGNNVNQIARALNSGFRAGFHGEVEEVRASVNSLIQFLTAKFDDLKLQRGGV